MNKQIWFYVLPILFALVVGLNSTGAALVQPIVEAGAQSLEWTVVPSPTTNHLNAVAMVSIVDGWAMGDDGTILHWNGSNWKVVTSPTISRLNAVAMLSPVDGIVTHINKQLTDNPQILNESPYDKGWLFTIEPTTLRKNLKSLYFGEEAHNFISTERDKLFSMANEDMRISADGGESIADIFEGLEGKDWAEFVKVFLKT